MAPTALVSRSTSAVRWHRQSVESTGYENKTLNPNRLPTSAYGNLLGGRLSSDTRTCNEIVTDTIMTVDFILKIFSAL